MFGLTLSEVMWLLTIAILVDGLWLCKAILWKSKPKAKGAQVLQGKGVKIGKVADLSDLNYSDPWAREVH